MHSVLACALVRVAFCAWGGCSAGVNTYSYAVVGWACLGLAVVMVFLAVALVLDLVLAGGKGYMEYL